MAKKQNGFSLIELLIVVAIILIIAAIAIPNLLSARKAANESSAVGSLRTIDTGEASIQVARGVYTCNLMDLGQAANGGLGYIDNSLASATNANRPKSGYFFTASVFANTCTPSGQPVQAPPAAPTVDFSWGADPASPGNTGWNAWCTNTSMQIFRDATATPAQAGSSAACAAANPPVALE